MTLGVFTAAIAGSAFPGHEVSYLVGLGKKPVMAMVIYFAICFGKITFTTLNAYGSFYVSDHHCFRFPSPDGVVAEMPRCFRRPDGRGFVYYRAA